MTTDQKIIAKELKSTPPTKEPKAEVDLLLAGLQKAMATATVQGSKQRLMFGSILKSRIKRNHNKQKISDVVAIEEMLMDLCEGTPTRSNWLLSVHEHPEKQNVHIYRFELKSGQYGYTGYTPIARMSEVEASYKARPIEERRRQPLQVLLSPSKNGEKRIHVAPYEESLFVTPVVTFVYDDKHSSLIEWHAGEPTSIWAEDINNPWVYCGVPVHRI